MFDTDDDDQQQQGPKALREAYETEKQKRIAAEAQIAEANEARRKLALIEAGIDLKSPTGELFAKAYDGEMTPEAITAAAQRYGVVAPPPPVTAPPAEQAAWDRMNAANAGSGPADALTPSDLDRIKQAESPEEIERAVREINERGRII